MKKPPTETFGQRVARLRTAADLTQDELAAKAELPVGSLRNYEYDHRRPRADAALRLARALGVTVEELLVLPSSKPARAGVQDPPGLRGLKRAWARAKEDERRQFLELVAAETPPSGSEAINTEKVTYRLATRKKNRGEHARVQQPKLGTTSETSRKPGRSES